MDYSKQSKKTYGAGVIGPPSTGAAGSLCVGSPASLSSDYTVRVVDRQAPVKVTATGEASASNQGSADEKRAFVRKPRVSRTPPSIHKDSVFKVPRKRLESVDLTGDESETDGDSDVSRRLARGRKIGKPPPQQRKESLTLEEKVDASLAVLERVLNVINDHNVVFDNLILKKEGETDCALKSTYVSFKDNIREVMLAVTDLRKAHTDHTRSGKNSDTYQMKTKTMMTPGGTSVEQPPEKEKKTIATQTESDGRCDFPPLPNRQKRKEITPPPPTDNQGKRKRFFNTQSETPRERRPVDRYKGRVQDVGEDSGEGEWTEIRRRRRKTNLEDTDRTEMVTPNRNARGINANERGGGSKNTPRRAVKPQAIAVRFGEFAPGSDLDELRKNLDGKLGVNVEVSKLQTMMDVEMRGIDPLVEKEEVLEAIRAELGHEAKGVRVKVLRTDPRMSKVAVIEGPAADMQRILRANRIMIGWTVVSAREIPRLLRCFKCHGIGHIAGGCKLVVGDGGLCRKCGAVRHHMKDCPNEPKCRLCVEDGLSESQTGHVAASVNLNHCRLAHDLLAVSAREQEADILVLSEPYLTPDNWFTDLTGRASISITNTGIAKSRKLTVLSCDKGFVCINYNDICIMSVYASPNDSSQAFEAQLASMEMFLAGIKGTLSKVIVAGDFNAKSPLWGSKNWCSRGRTLYQWCNGLGLTPTIAKGGVTCDRGGGSVVDLLFCSNDAMKLHVSSDVLDIYTASDHRYIVRKFGRAKTDSMREKDPFDLGKPKIDEAGLLEELIRKYRDEAYDKRVKTGTTLEVDKFIEDVDRLVNKYTSYRGPYKGNKTPVYWWNEDTARCKKEVNKARRRYTRLRAKGNERDIEEAYKVYKTAQKTMKRAVEKAKKTSWKNMLTDIDKDIWGRPYKVVTWKLKGKGSKPDILSAEEVESVVKKLFILSPPRLDTPEKNAEIVVRTVENEDEVIYLPDEPGCTGAPEKENNNDWNGERRGTGYLPGGPREIPERETEIREREINVEEELPDVPVPVPVTLEHRRVGGITPEEITLVVRCLPVNKAPGPDRMPTSVAKKFSLRAARWLAYIYNICYARGYWPRSWKTGRLVLLPKGKATRADERAYRPLSVISCLAKIPEKLVKTRILRELENNDLADNQYGFRKGRSTLDAMDKVDGIWQKARKDRRHCLLVLLDVKNAFNTIRWGSIIRCLEERGFAPELVNLIRSYLDERWIVYNAAEGELNFQVFGGVPQGSVIGPILWNLVYDGLLRVRLRRDVHQVAYADDIGIVIVDVDLARLVYVAQETIKDLGIWYKSEGLSLAHHKTEAILLTGRKVAGGLSVICGDAEIRTARTARYLGLILGMNHGFKSHIETACSRALKYAGVLAHLMPNLGGAGNLAWRLFYRVVESVILYAAPLWVGGLELRTNCNLLSSTQRTALLRVAQAYRTTSWDALCVITGQIPIDLLLKERARIYAKRKENRELSNEEIARIKKEEREVTMDTWERRWTASTKGRWTFQLIPNIREWVTWGPKFLSYHVTQVLTGHGCFGSYLLRIGKQENAFCWFCEGHEDNPEHFLLHCSRWREKRATLNATIGENLGVGNFIRLFGDSRSREQIIMFFKSDKGHFSSTIVLPLEHGHVHLYKLTKIK
uniref:uncharacterized protein LOC117611332 n=1 Tax=Osmia lignaria TaxID=473952 RepID=UPI001479417A|nr:uncharacterized protein LOC117611332 [Osmia lignaria]